MSSFCLLLTTVLLLKLSHACDNNVEQYAAVRDDSAEYLANVYGYGPRQLWGPYYYQPSSQVPVFVSQYQGRTPISEQQSVNNNAFLNFINRNNVDDGNLLENRGVSNFGASILNAGLFNNRFTSGSTTRPFASFINRFPVIINPNFANPISAFDSCTAPSGESGICAPGAVCSLFGGRPSGSCALGGVCCINAITTCGGSITLNNTYWQSPTTPVSGSSTCALTVKLDTKLTEQKRSICQIRLDFISFSIAQPTNGDCTDTFRVGGAINSVPAICGENNGQHMYIQVPPSNTNPTDIQLMFNFGTATTTRSWNIKISMLPCGASYLAPDDCLQYFTASTGKVISFNWKDIDATGGQRQLNNQLYNICFRTELVDSKRADKICLLPCTTTATGADAFSLTTGIVLDITPLSGTAPGALAGCLEDYIIFQNGLNNALVAADRFCGSALNSDLTAVASGQVCSSIKPFRITFNTDGIEATGIDTDANNQGFCLDFHQS